LNTVTELNQLGRQRLEELTVAVARPGQAARPAVRVVQLNGCELVIKDYATQGSWFKRLLGSFLVAREKAAYQRLEDVEGVPRCYGTLGPCILVLERVAAQPVLAAAPEQLSDDFLEVLTALVTNLHRRGVAHGDLEKLTNILVDQHGQPVLVDFAASIITGSNPLAALLFPLLCDSDWRGVHKLTKHIAPGQFTAEQQQALTKRSWIERLFRRIREPLREFIKRCAYDR